MMRSRHDGHGPLIYGRWAPSASFLALYGCAWVRAVASWYAKVDIVRGGFKRHTKSVPNTGADMHTESGAGVPSFVYMQQVCDAHMVQHVRIHNQCHST